MEDQPVSKFSEMWHSFEESPLLTGGDTNEYVTRPLDPESASVAVAVKMSVPSGCD